MGMGRGEELGSGILNVNKNLPFYTKGAKPQFIEGDPFVTIILPPAEVSERPGLLLAVRLAHSISMPFAEA